MSDATPDIEDDLKVLDRKLSQLKREYDQYFLGTRPREPVLLAGGCSGWRQEHDHRSRVEIREFVDLEGEPVVVEGGYARAEANADRKGWRYLDRLGQLVREGRSSGEGPCSW